MPGGSPEILVMLKSMLLQPSSGTIIYLISIIGDPLFTVWLFWLPGGAKCVLNTQDEPSPVVEVEVVDVVVPVFPPPPVEVVVPVVDVVVPVVDVVLEVDVAEITVIVPEEEFEYPDLGGQSLFPVKVKLNVPNVVGVPRRLGSLLELGVLRTNSSMLSGSLSHWIVKL